MPPNDTSRLTGVTVLRLMDAQAQLEEARLLRARALAASERDAADPALSRMRLLRVRAWSALLMAQADLSPTHPAYRPLTLALESLFTETDAIDIEAEALLRLREALQRLLQRP